MQGWELTLDTASMDLLALYPASAGCADCRFSGQCMQRRLPRSHARLWELPIMRSNLSSSRQRRDTVEVVSVHPAISLVPCITERPATAQSHADASNASAKCQSTKGCFTKERHRTAMTAFTPAAQAPDTARVPKLKITPWDTVVTAMLQARATTLRMNC
jgi:hypothetical protein